jgi:hypothetical protein
MRRGRFTEDELMSAGKPFEGMGSSDRPRPMRERSILTGEATQSAKDAAQKKIDDAKAAAARAEAEARRAKTQGARAAADRKKSALEEAVKKAEAEKEALNIPARKQDLKELQQLALPKNISPLSELLTTAFLGTMIGGPLAGTLGGVAAGTAIGRGLATQGAQRALTGNTGVQQGMRNLAENETMRFLAEQIRRNAARQAAMGVQ